MNAEFKILQKDDTKDTGQVYISMSMLILFSFPNRLLLNDVAVRCLYH